MAKRPRYWVALAVALLVFLVIWIVVVRCLPRFASTAPDAIHSVSLLKGNSIQYHPLVSIWIADYGLFFMMALLFILALITAFKRTAILKGKR